jgi:hypothetical protein
MRPAGLHSAVIRLNQGEGTVMKLDQRAAVRFAEPALQIGSDRMRPDVVAARAMVALSFFCPRDQLNASTLS